MESEQASAPTVRLRLPGSRLCSEFISLGVGKFECVSKRKQGRSIRPPSPSPFKRTDGVPAQSGSFGELFLGQPGEFAKLPQMLPKQRFIRYVHRHSSLPGKALQA